VRKLTPTATLHVNEKAGVRSEVDPERGTAGAAFWGATAGFDGSAVHFTISNPLLVAVPGNVGEGEASISVLAELAGEAQPVGSADRPHIHGPS
jgi:hypothetical protein